MNYVPQRLCIHTIGIAINQVSIGATGEKKILDNWESFQIPPPRLRTPRPPNIDSQNSKYNFLGLWK
jgi:hypothetical protein